MICHDDASPPPSTSVTVYEETSWPGARLPHIWRADGTSLFDQLGTGFALLRVGSAAPSGDAVIAGADVRGIPLAVLDITEPEAVDKSQQFGLVLVRPDQHIAWRADTDPDAAAAEEMWATVTGHRISEPAVPRNCRHSSGCPTTNPDLDVLVGGRRRVH